MRKPESSQNQRSRPRFSKIPPFLFSILTVVLVACSSPSRPPQSIPVPPGSSSPAICESFNQGDPLNERIGTGALLLKLPVDRRAASERTAIVIPVSDFSQTFWVERTPTGWKFADKQTVAIASNGLLDLQAMHRLNPMTHPKIVQVIALSSEHWAQKIMIQPVLEGTTSRWGKLFTYPVRLSVQGQVHAFRGIHQGISGDALPQYLNRVLDQLEPGSVYVPKNTKVELMQPAIASPQICPVTRSAFPTH